MRFQNVMGFSLIMALLAACSSTSNAPAPGSTGSGTNTADAGFTCGKQGDPGNELGVGKYCDTSSDCASASKATLCATLGDPGAHFCTLACMSGDATGCGNNAACMCSNGECGCLPNQCKN
jgi:hypothetical protein